MIGESRIVVRYAETDKMGVVYHANYLIWFEVARTEFLEAIGQPYAKLEEQGIMSPVLRIECDYNTPLHYGDVAIVRTRVVTVSGVRTVFVYEVYREGQEIEKEAPCCVGKSLHCLVSSSDFKPLVLKKAAPQLYEAYLSILEPEG